MPGFALPQSCSPEQWQAAGRGLRWLGLKSTERLARAREKIDRDHAAGMIHSEEYAFYGQIIALAEVGRWQEAEQLAVRFRRGQRR